MNNNKPRLLVDLMVQDHPQEWEEEPEEEEAEEEEDKFQDSKLCKEEVESDIISKYVNIILRHIIFKIILFIKF